MKRERITQGPQVHSARSCLGCAIRSASLRPERLSTWGMRGPVSSARGVVGVQQDLLRTTAAGAALELARAHACTPLCRRIPVRGLFGVAMQGIHHGGQDSNTATSPQITCATTAAPCDMHEYVYRLRQAARHLPLAYCACAAQEHGTMRTRAAHSNQAKLHQTVPDAP